MSSSLLADLNHTKTTNGLAYCYLQHIFFFFSPYLGTTGLNQNNESQEILEASKI